MFLRCLSTIAILGLLVSQVLAGNLRVCADPDNLPMSNSKAEGYENHIVAMLGKALGEKIHYVWWNDRRMSALEALQKNRCDLVPGTLFKSPGVLTTRPYLRSIYAFVSPASTPVTGFDDARLKTLKIGVQSIGDEAVTPPVSALLHRDLASNIKAYTLHGNYSDPNSAGEIVKAVAAHDIDAAVLWGPQAGYFAARQQVPLVLTPAISNPADPPMSYTISMAVRDDDPDLLQAINDVLRQRQSEIQHILNIYHVPMLPAEISEASP
jgi:mxaJ protein